MESMRTCIGCRSRASRDELLRLIRVDGELVLDFEGRLPGRGAWVHYAPCCVRQMLQSGSYRRAFKTHALELRQVEQHLKTLLENTPAAQ